MKHIARVLVPGFLMLAATPALAQQATDGPAALEEIVVTARRAEENLQKVPLSITALGAAEIEAMGISRVPP